MEGRWREHPGFLLLCGHITGMRCRIWKRHHTEGLEHPPAHWSRHAFTPDIKRRTMSISTNTVKHTLNRHAVMCASGLVGWIRWDERLNNARWCVLNRQREWFKKSQTCVYCVLCSNAVLWRGDVRGKNKKDKLRNPQDVLCADAMSHLNDIFSTGPGGACTIYANSHYWKLAEQRRGSEQKQPCVFGRQRQLF